MRLSKEQAEQLVKEALNSLKEAHHGYFKNASTDDEIELDDMIVDAIECFKYL